MSNYLDSNSSTFDELFAINESGYNETPITTGYLDENGNDIGNGRYFRHASGPTVTTGYLDENGNDIGSYFQKAGEGFNFPQYLYISFFREQLFHTTYKVTIRVKTYNGSTLTQNTVVTLANGTSGTSGTAFRNIHSHRVQWLGTSGGTSWPQTADLISDMDSYHTTGSYTNAYNKPYRFTLPANTDKIDVSWWRSQNATGDEEITNQATILNQYNNLFTTTNVRTGLSVPWREDKGRIYRFTNPVIPLEYLYISIRFDDND